MNFAENLLYSRIPGQAHSKRGTIGKEDGKPDYAWAKDFKLVINAESGMEKEVLIPDHEKLGEVALSLLVVADEEKVVVTVEKGTVTSAWEVVVAGRKIKSAKCDGKVVESISNEQGGVSASKGVSKVEIIYV